MSYDDVFPPTDVPFGVSIICLPVRGQIPQNPNFRGVNRRFPDKLVKSKNVHIIQTTASITTKFRTVIKTTKYPSWVVQTRLSQIQNEHGYFYVAGSTVQKIGIGQADFFGKWVEHMNIYVARVLCMKY